jgi:ABC-type methionine transport system permease subunit
MNELDALSSLGFQLPSPGYLAGAFLFGLLGWVAYRYGKKREQPRVKWAGVAMMLYPYAVPQTWLLWLVGCALCGWVWWEVR